MRFIFLVILTLAPLISVAKIIHQERSLYRNIVVNEDRGRRCLVFTIKRDDRNQTCKDVSNPKRVVFPYVRMTLSGLLVNPNPENILVVGLGGGTIPTVLTELYPDANIKVVEIDEAVVKVAKTYFEFRETDKLTVDVSDARVFIKRARLRKEKYDMVILDAFTGEYIPEHLMTAEFLSESKDLLVENGVLIANTFSTSKLYSHESVTYTQVFGNFLNLKMPDTGNRVIVAVNGKLPGDFALKSRAKQLSARLQTYGVQMEVFPRFMSRKVDWDESKRVLTDQYSPANLLQED
jgi:spermidine synthase